MDDLIAHQQIEIEVLREKVRQLQDVVAPPDVVIPLEWRLTTNEARIFSHLTTREFATKQSIMAALYSDRADDDIEIKIVDVFVCKMRKKILPFGIEIETIWGQGYGLKNRSQYI